MFMLGMCKREEKGCEREKVSTLNDEDNDYPREKSLSRWRNDDCCAHAASEKFSPCDSKCTSVPRYTLN